ncbi:hypothetical protein F5J12DRAFT_788651 [Pisolithus orientalis]|uniref:uncharacterized protein n=1 Tax=Pisolithus orientalis TaxID=936130 RepID=UPI0022240097|nr:uncharacterized protein F5J12DRAFT_788651 [Pisolithus orientalis]KAI5981387.1 hypothetical protein F5J12DRAFT_788651 [Pisolithus orientalis]
MSKTPHGWQMELTDCIASYMKARFQEEVFSRPHTLPDILILFLVLCEADHISSSMSGKIRVEKPAMQKLLRDVEVTELAILVTNSNTIHIWYLPDALSPKRRDSIKASPQAWQTDKSYFHDNAELKGAINLSPAWFQQGHGPQNGFLEASWLLKSRTENTSTREWVNQMSNTNALLSVILHVFHLQMYADGREALICLGKQVEQQVDLDMSSMYSSMSMMVNQATCYHRDINGWDPWYDMLVTVGNYPPLDFVIPTLNLQLHYNPGMIIAFSGSALEHGVGAVDSDRACLDMLALELQTGGVAKILQMGRCFNIIDWVGTQN